MPPTEFDAAPRGNRYIPTLDGWRAVAIVIVMLQHASDEITRVVGSWTEPATDVFRENGRLGVSIFFAISGFLITSLLVGEWSQTSAINLRSFYIRRAFRILPPLVVVLSVFGILGLLDVIPIPLDKWVGALLFVYNYVPSEGTWYLGHFWSLAIEEHFYLVWPALLAFFGPRRARPVCAGLIAGVAAWRLLDLSLDITAGWTINYKDRTDTQADGLLWGCLLALMFVDPRARRFVGTLTRAWRFWVILALLVVTQGAKSSNAWFTSIQLAVRPMLIVLLVVGTIVRPRSVVGRILELRPFSWLGRISYSLYLWQQLFLVWDGFDADLGPLQSFPISVVAALVCATLSYRFIERPTIALGRRLASRVRSPEPRPSPEPVAFPTA